MKLTEGSPVIVAGNHPYSGNKGVIASVSNAEGYVRVRFPHYGRYGQVVEIRADLLQADSVDVVGGVCNANGNSRN